MVDQWLFIPTKSEVRGVHVHLWLTWQLGAGWEKSLEHALALLKELLGGEQAVEAALVDEDAGGLGRLLAHHLGLERPVEHLAVPR